MVGIDQLKGASMRTTERWISVVNILVKHLQVNRLFN